MPRAIRFHLDENCTPRVAHALRQHGIDVTTAGEAGLLGASDGEHLTFATASGRVFFTRDADFLRLHANGRPHHGIVYSRPGRLTVGDTVRLLVLIWELLEPAEMRGRIEYL